MNHSNLNREALRARTERLRAQRRRLAPKTRLSLQAGLAVFGILTTAVFGGSQGYQSGAIFEEAFAAAEEGAILAIDSPSFTLDMIAKTEDGFLIKNAGQTTANVDRSNLADIVEYTVEDGDNLSLIAYNFGVSTDTIIWENAITNPHNLKPGTTLRILPVDGITHAIGDSDTLASVAKKYKLDTAVLSKQNQLEEDAILIAGTKLIIPGGKKMISTGNPYIAKTGTVAAYTYTSKVPVDGAIISANGAGNKTGRWMIKPTEGVYTTYFGGRRNHWAVDIADRSMPDINASADGTVVKSQCGWNGGYGCMVVIDHGDGYQTLYGHLDSIDVGVNTAVTQGQKIGVMGNTGRVYGKTGIHLHFEVIANGIKKNPLAFY